MKQKRIVACQSFSGLILLLFLSGCSVVKTPYSTTDYYKQTISRLDSLKQGITTSDDSIYAGFSRISITPGLNATDDNAGSGHFKKVPIAGFGQIREKPATGIHDSLYIKAIALNAGNQLIVIVSADMLLMPPNLVDEVVSMLGKEGLKRSQIFFCATHTHSGIGGWGYGILAKLMAGKENKNIEKWLTEQIKESVLAAISDLKPSKLGSGSFNASPYTRNRLTGNPLEINNDFSFVLIEQVSGRKAIMGSFSAHATTIGSKNTLISADYPGYWERKTELKFADLAIFCAGSTGSQSPVGQGNDFERAKYIGEALADSLSVNKQRVSLNEKPGISSLSLKIYLPDYHMRFTKNRNFTTGFSKKMMPLPESVYLQALRINNLIWIFTPGDFSGESALQLKNAMSVKGYETIVTGFNGSYVGYIMPGKYFYLDHYEPKSMGWFGPTMGDYTMELIYLIAGSLIN